MIIDFQSLLGEIQELKNAMKELTATTEIIQDEVSEITLRIEKMRVEKLLIEKLEIEGLEIELCLRGRG